MIALSFCSFYRLTIIVFAVDIPNATMWKRLSEMDIVSYGVISDDYVGKGSYTAVQKTECLQNMFQLNA